MCNSLDVGNTSCQLSALHLLFNGHSLLKNSIVSKKAQKFHILDYCREQVQRRSACALMRVAVNLCIHAAVVG